MADDLLGGTEAHQRIERILRGERIVTAATATIPAYYGPNATTAEVCRSWLSMWQRMAEIMNPADVAFYQSNAIGWASR